MIFEDLEIELINLIGQNYLDKYPKKKRFTLFNSHNNQDVVTKLANLEDSYSVVDNWLNLIEIYREFTSRKSSLAKQIERIFSAVLYDVEFSTVVLGGYYGARYDLEVEEVADIVELYLDPPGYLNSSSEETARYEDLRTITGKNIFKYHNCSKRGSINLREHENDIHSSNSQLGL